MSYIESPASTSLTASETNLIVPCDDNFALTAIEGEHDGDVVRHVFDPPYRLTKGHDYALYENATGRVELWQVEHVQRGRWRWVQEAKRARAKPVSLRKVMGEPVGTPADFVDSRHDRRRSDADHDRRRARGRPRSRAGADGRP